MADYDVVVWTGLGVLLFLALLVAPHVGRVLAPGRRQAKRVHVSIAAADERDDVLPDGSAGSGGATSSQLSMVASGRSTTLSSDAS